MAPKKTSWYAVLAHLALAVADPASNFDISPSEAKSYGCGSKCQKMLQLGYAEDREVMGTDFDFAFYETASNFSTSIPGDILKVQGIDPETLTVDSGLTAYKIQYTSADSSGNPVPVTGFVAFPALPPSWSTGAYPVVAYSHGTLGMYRGCAPSSSPSFFDYKSWPLITERGYAVIATDYQGLGNNHTTHKYLSWDSHARDVYYSVVAARKAFGHMLTKGWVSVGHSQGGSSVWNLAEIEHQLALNTSSADGKYLGTVSLAPAPKIRDIVYWAVNNVLSLSDFHRWIVTAELPFIAAGLRAVFPSFNVSSILAEPMRKRLKLSDRAQMCTVSMMALTADLSREQLFSSTLVQEAHTNATGNLLSKLQEMTPIANGAQATAPLLVVQGTADTSVIPAITFAAYEEACRTPGYDIQLSLYEGQDHSPTVVATAPEWLDWIKDRFAGVKTSGKCSLIRRAPLDAKLTKQDREVDFGKIADSV
ncbi:alpha/beta-hydrolase [Setomelanomma holmii]|uniref:Alpha/beta-hydrolase n=1 Tax=Setomelanomma holmii TaxID=210430 RepID=A0A9P4GWV2_9PLEO|nr:alpha/beta-hydrolase [Setomelanomma holmii]